MVSSTGTHVNFYHPDLTLGTLNYEDLATFKFDHSDIVLYHETNHFQSIEPIDNKVPDAKTLGYFDDTSVDFDYSTFQPSSQQPSELPTIQDATGSSAFSTAFSTVLHFFCINP